MLSSEARFRLRSLRDCSVIRAHMGDRGMIELIKWRLARRRYIRFPVEGEQCDYLLTDEGRECADRLARDAASVGASF